MKLILKLIGTCIAIVVVFFLLAGLLSSKDFEDHVSETFVAPPQEIWRVISTPEQRQERLGFTKISEKTTTDLGLSKWVEHNDDEWSRYEILAFSQPFTMTLALMESSEKFSGLWTYTLSSEDGIHTKLIIHEKSRLNDFSTRSITTLKGRNSGLRAELRSIKQALIKGIPAEEPPTQNAE
jgi:hypothetical protein